MNENSIIISQAFGLDRVLPKCIRTYVVRTYVRGTKKATRAPHR